MAGRDNSPRNWIMAVQLVDDFDPKTSLTLDALRALADDIDVGNASYVNTLASLTLQHFFTGKIGAAAAVSYQERDYLDNLTEPVTGALKIAHRQDMDLRGGRLLQHTEMAPGQARIPVSRTRIRTSISTPIMSTA